MQKPQLIAVGLLSSGILTAAGPAAADCVFAKLGEMKVDSSAGPMVVDIEIGGVKKKMMINSGSPLSTLTEAGAASLGVKSIPVLVMLRPGDGKPREVSRLMGNAEPEHVLDWLAGAMK